MSKVAHTEDMAKATWEGYIAIGQLGLPVRLYSAVQSIRPEFVQLHEADGSPVERVLRCRDENKEISYDEVVRAVEATPGHYVTLNSHEIEQTIDNPIKTIELKQFINSEDIEPYYYEKPYYVVPRRGGERAYALLREVLTRSQKAAVSLFNSYNRARIGVLNVEADILMLNQLRFADEIVPRSSIKTPPLPKPSPEEIDALSSVVKRFSGPFYIRDYHDEHAEKVRQLVERKLKGLKPPRRERLAPHATPEDEIVNALEGTLDAKPQLGEGI